MTHRTIAPSILYFGTPVVLISTENPDGSTNLAPMSSAWWLGQRSLIGLDASSQSTLNLLRTGQCVLNLPSEDLVPNVNLLAKTTGTPDLPPHKVMMGYAHVKDKFAHSRLTPQLSDLVRPLRVRQCPVQMEAELVHAHKLMQDVQGKGDLVYACEVRIVRVHAMDVICSKTKENHIDPDAWKPIVMTFQRFYGVAGEIMPSRLAEIPEESYKGLNNTGLDEELAAAAREGHAPPEPAGI